MGRNKPQQSRNRAATRRRRLRRVVGSVPLRSARYRAVPCRVTRGDAPRVPAAAGRSCMDLIVPAQELRLAEEAGTASLTAARLCWCVSFSDGEQNFLLAAKFLGKISLAVAVQTVAAQRPWKCCRPARLQPRSSGAPRNDRPDIGASRGVAFRQCDDVRSIRETRLSQHWKQKLKDSVLVSPYYHSKQRARKMIH